MIDTCRGVLRVRKWPKKYGKPRSALQAWWVDWFRQAIFMAKYADGMTQARAIELTKGTGLYPRDIMIKAMRGRLLYWTDEDGMTWYPMAAIKDISDTLDILAQTIGSVLVRATDRWRAPDPGNFDDVLTYKGSTDPPEWQAVAGGGGVTQQVLPGTPIAVDNSVNFYDFDVSDYASLTLIIDDMDFAASDHVRLLLSTDGGSSFRSGASDYHDTYTDGATQVVRNTAAFNIARINAATGLYVDAVLDSLRAGRATCRAKVGNSTNLIRDATDHANFDGPITDIRLITNGGNNFKLGTIHLVGLK